MKFWRINTWLVIILICFGQAQAETPAAQDPVLIPEKAISAPVYTDIDGAVQHHTVQQHNMGSKQGVYPEASSQLSSQSKGQFDQAPSIVPNENAYPLIGKMEMITFGKDKAGKPIEERLGDLEQEVFRTKFASQSLFDRTEKLKLTILGPQEILEQNLEQNQSYSSMAPLLSVPAGAMSFLDTAKEPTYFELIARSAENQLPVQGEELPKFALQLLNNARGQLNFDPLSMDAIASKMAQEQIGDLSKRKVVSHSNEQGQNPDIRYTILGGEGAIAESLLSLKPEYVKENKYTRALVANAFKILLERQDDREALLSPDATGFGFAIHLLPEQRRAMVCIEVSTKHGAIAPLPKPLKIGDKMDVSGSIEPPYKFARVSLAWEGLSNSPPMAAEEVEEALPYFPPLDFVGYGRKSEHDYSGAMTALKMGLLVGVVAGSMFMPPVAFAAPLIAVSPGVETKPVSDIPIHGGIKVDGNSFYGKVNLSNGGKPGIYYITVWATTENNSKPLAISRRAFILTERNSEEEVKASSKDKKSAKKMAKEEIKQARLSDKQ